MTSRSGHMIRMSRGSRVGVGLQQLEHGLPDHFGLAGGAVTGVNLDGRVVLRPPMVPVGTVAGFSLSRI